MIKKRFTRIEMPTAEDRRWDASFFDFPTVNSGQIVRTGSATVGLQSLELQTRALRLSDITMENY